MRQFLIHDNKEAQPIVSASEQQPHLSPIEPGLMVIHGNRQEDLRDLLAAWLQRTPL